MTASTDYTYLSGFHHEHASEAKAGALPLGQFSPQRPPYGLYAEKFSATAFTAPRDANRRNWFYRIRPSVTHGRYTRLAPTLWRTSPLADDSMTPEQLRWDPWPVPDAAQDFIDGMVTIAANGNAALQTGIGVQVYVANQSMARRYFYNADGEMLLVPQQGRLRLFTECGRLQVSPGEIALIPRGMKFRVELPDGPSRGYVCENYGAMFRLPERGLIGSDGLANARDFLAPTAWYEDREGDYELVAKFGGQLFGAPLDHSPLDVVAWVGTAAPLKYDLARFNTLGTVSFDHPDPSIFTVLTSPSELPGIANADFVIFPPRWLVADDTFRPPWFHRNVMSEFMGLIAGRYEAREKGFEPGGSSLHNCMAPHGPEPAVHAKASHAELVPTKLAETMAFMFESKFILQPTAQALNSPHLQQDYLASWAGLQRHFPNS